MYFVHPLSILVHSIVYKFRILGAQYRTILAVKKIVYVGSHFGFDRILGLWRKGTRNTDFPTPVFVIFEAFWQILYLVFTFPILGLSTPGIELTPLWFVLKHFTHYAIVSNRSPKFKISTTMEWSHRFKYSYSWDT